MSTRRDFLRKVAATGAATWTVGTTRPRAWGAYRGANEVIRVAVVGLRGRGQLHIEMVSKIPGLQLVAVCDPDQQYVDREKAAAAKRGQTIAAFRDVRKVLERDDIDAITLATPNHWHSLAGIWACQAGKDAYIEKPVSHNVWEGRQLVNAARKYGCMVQAGTQARANPDLIEAVDWLRAGHLGRIRYALGSCYKARLPIGKVGKGTIPPTLDYDLWTGPAPLTPLARTNLHYDWHWIHAYGNGDLGNQGIHEMDIARWCLGYRELAPRVLSVGGRLGYDDDGETPNSQLVYHDYGGPPLIFEVRGLPKAKAYHTTEDTWKRNMDLPDGFDLARGIGVSVICEGGRLIVIEGGESLFAVDTAGKLIRRFDRADPQLGKGWSKGDYHTFQNWLTAIRSRNTADLKAEILEGHLSSALCHTGMISYRLGEPATAREVAEELAKDPLYADRFASFRDHLERNGVDVSQPCITLGSSLTVDPLTEQFVGNDQANALLTRDYRSPFAVPEVGQEASADHRS